MDKRKTAAQKHYLQDARAFGLLANAKRLQILDLLLKQELQVAEIITSIGAPKANISQHLRILKENGFIKSRRSGSKMYYKIRNPMILILKILFRKFVKYLTVNI